MPATLSLACLQRPEHIRWQTVFASRLGFLSNNLGFAGIGNAKKYVPDHGRVI